MRWNSLQFMDALKACGNRYVSENAWHTWGGQHRYSMDAFKLYHCASTNALGMLLLGSGKIRFADDLLSNFGMTSGSGTDDKMLEKVQALQTQRTAMRTAPGMRDAPNVVGPGSILSDRNWSPLLNDSYILGGVHAGHEFHFAEDAASAEFSTMPVQLTPAQKWQAFIKKHPATFWDDKNHLPRVLSRELIGLKTFGYRPEFSSASTLVQADGIWRRHLHPISRGARGWRIHRKRSRPHVRSAVGVPVRNGRGVAMIPASTRRRIVEEVRDRQLL